MYLIWNNIATYSIWLEAGHHWSPESSHTQPERAACRSAEKDDARDVGNKNALTLTGTILREETLARAVHTLHVEDKKLREGVDAQGRQVSEIPELASTKGI